MRIAVTGGAGFIGQHLVTTLSNLGHQVRVLDNMRRGQFTAICEISECIQGDVRDRAAVEAAFAGADAVVHLAAQSNVMGSQTDPEYTYATNIAGTWNVLAACKSAGVRHLIFASSREAYGEALQLPVPEGAPLRPKNMYGATKVSGELLVSLSPTPSTILRLGNVYGKGDSGRILPLWVAAARMGQPLTLYGGEQILDFLSVSVAVEAFVRTLDIGPIADPINVASGQPTRLVELAHRVIDTFNSSSSIVLAPRRGIEVMAFVADVSRMTQVLGIEPPADSLAGITEI